MPSLSELRPCSVLTVNAGSSSIRLDMIHVEGGATRRMAGCRTDIDAQPEKSWISAMLTEAGAGPDLVAHRIVHGGGNFSDPTLLDAGVEKKLTELIPLAPLHLPPALAWIRSLRDVLGTHLPTVCVFDTAFFARLPQRATTYAIPGEMAKRFGLRRYGFHGLAHASLWRRWRALRRDLTEGGNLITLHLGSGCSAAAISAGRPLDTSMGFSPLEGLVMATRCGDLDPGLITHLQRCEGLNPDQLDRLLSTRSGLLGLSGVSADVRDLLASDRPAAHLALEVFSYRVRKYIGAYLAVLGNVDGLVFGGGIGEHAAAVRAQILAGLEPLGFHLDVAANAHAVGNDARIASHTSAVDIRVLQVDEASELARDAAQLVAARL